MLGWIDFSALGPALDGFRRWLDKQPRRDFSELTVWRKVGRLALILFVLLLFTAPLVWFFAQ
jgi:hypothetical protein